jgi:general secretion pathway protein A
MYERFFGLADTPFRLTPDPRYLFLSRKHAEALAHLKLGLRESSGFVCITGDVGTGKTTLLRAFLTGLGSEVATAYIFNPALSALELLQTINSELGLPATSPSRKVLTDALNTHLLRQREAGRRSIVVIDEAQALSIDVLEQLRLLSNLETTTEKLLRIVLVGQPQLRALLMHPELVQLNQRITLRWHMGPLAKRETAAYVRHRLKVAAGTTPPRIFTRAAIRLLHRLSGGVPRLINLIAHRAMLAAFAADSRVVNARIVRQAYREIGAVPLAAVAPPRRAAWAAVGVGAFLGIAAVGADRLGWRTDFRLPGVAQNSAPTDVAAVVPPPEPAPAPSPAADPTPAVPAADPTPAAPAAEATPPAPVADAAAPAPSAEPAPPTAEAPAPAEPVVAAVEPSAPPAPSPPPVDVAQRLAARDAPSTARAAVEALLAAWHTRPLAAGEPVAMPDLARVANARGLEYLPLFGNASMLRLLDLPAILEVRIPGTDGPRWVTLVGLSDGRYQLVVGGEPIAVDAAFLERHWFGQAHLLWRDFESLGPTFGRDGGGGQVARLQALLRGVGAYHGAVNGVFDAPTEAAVLAFQRSRLLAADGRVGKLTRIVLYGAAGGYARPTLGSPS